MDKGFYCFRELCERTPQLVSLQKTIFFEPLAHQFERMGFPKLGFLGKGESARVFGTPEGEIVWRLVQKNLEPCRRFGGWPKCPEVLQPLPMPECKFVGAFDGAIHENPIHFLLEAFPHIKTEGVKMRHARQLEGRMRSKGYGGRPEGGFWAMDVSPENVGFCTDGTPVILDAGDITLRSKQSNILTRARLGMGNMLDPLLLRNPFNSWDYTKQTAGLTRDWVVFVKNNLKAHAAKEMDVVAETETRAFQQMLENQGGTQGIIR